MEFVQYRTGKDDEGRRLDKVLRILFPETPLSSFYSALRKGLIRVNEKKVKQDYHISSGDVIYVAGFLDFSSRYPVGQDTITTDKYDDIFIFRNEHILILNKPYDIPVHETNSFKGVTLNQIVLNSYPSNEDSLSFTPGPLHRLDRKTTGIIAFSQSITGARVFTELLKAHEIKKTYLSVVDGKLPDTLTFTDMLIKDNDEESKDSDFHTVSVISSDCSSSVNAKIAVTTIKPLSYGTLNNKEITFVEVKIETGRTHQIRSQCAHHGFPLTGDSAYGGTRFEGFFLHAWKLEIPQPNALGLQNTLFAPIPARFVNFIEKYLPTVDISLYNK